MLERFQAVGTTVFNLTGHISKLQTSRSGNKRVTARLIDGTALRSESGNSMLRQSHNNIAGLHRIVAATVIGVARSFDWGGANQKLHAMTSQKFFERGTFCGVKML